MNEQTSATGLPYWSEAAIGYAADRRVGRVVVVDHIVGDPKRLS